MGEVRGFERIFWMCQRVPAILYVWVDFNLCCWSTPSRVTFRLSLRKLWSNRKPQAPVLSSQGRFTHATIAVHLLSLRPPNRGKNTEKSWIRWRFRWLSAPVNTCVRPARFLFECSAVQTSPVINMIRWSGDFSWFWPWTPSSSFWDKHCARLGRTSASGTFHPWTTWRTTSPVHSPFLGMDIYA